MLDPDNSAMEKNLYDCLAPEARAADMTDKKTAIVAAARLFAMGESSEPYHLGTLRRHARNIGRMALSCDDPSERDALAALHMRLLRIGTEGIEPFSMRRIGSEFYPLGRFCIETLRMSREQIGAMICPDGTPRQQLGCARFMEGIINRVERHHVVYQHFGHHLK